MISDAEENKVYSDQDHIILLQYMVIMFVSKRNFIFRKFDLFDKYPSTWRSSRVRP